METVQKKKTVQYLSLAKYQCFLCELLLFEFCLTDIGQVRIHAICVDKLDIN